MKSILKLEIINTIFIFILGVFLHFSFELSNNNVLVGVFSAVNESVFEHLKLIFFPMFLTTIFGSFYLKKDYPNYLAIKVKGIILSLAFTIIFFYTYAGIIGTNIAIIDIASFFVSVILGEFYVYRNRNKSSNNLIGLVLLIVLFLSFIVFTFYPPKIGLMKDPITNTYGIK